MNIAKFLRTPILEDLLTAVSVGIINYLVLKIAFNALKEYYTRWKSAKY